MTPEQLSIQLQFTHSAVLDCLVSDSAGVMPLFRDIVARTGQRPEVRDFLDLLGTMCDEGLLVETLPEGLTRQQAFEEYRRILPVIPLADLVADTIGTVYAPTHRGRAEWETWRRSFD
jgi:hypothetical protein